MHRHRCVVATDHDIVAGGFHPQCRQAVLLQHVAVRSVDNPAFWKETFVIVAVVVISSSDRYIVVVMTRTEIVVVVIAVIIAPRRRIIVIIIIVVGWYHFVSIIIIHVDNIVIISICGKGRDLGVQGMRRRDGRDLLLLRFQGWFCWPRGDFGHLTFFECPFFFPIDLFKKEEEKKIKEN